MKLLSRFIFLLLLVSCTKEPIVSTGCWTGLKDGKRQLINGQCFTSQQIESVEQSQTWQQILNSYSDKQYEANKTCEYCQSKYK